MATQKQVMSSVTPVAAVSKPAQQTKPGERLGVIGRYVAVVVVVFIALAPLYWTFITSIKSPIEVNASPPTLFPQSFTLQNYHDIFVESSYFLPDLKNSLIVASITTVLALIFGSLCAYALARTKFRGKAVVLAIVLAVNMFPFIAMVGPLFVLFTQPGLYIYNTYAGLIVPDLVITLPAYVL